MEHPPHEIDGLRRLIALSLELGRKQEVGRVLQAVADALLDLVDADRAFVILTGRRVVAASYADGQGGQPSLSVADLAIQEGQEVVTADISDHELAASHSVMDLQLRAVLCVPLHADDEVMGCLYADSARRGHDEMQERVWLARAYAAHASQAVMGARRLARARRRALVAREVAHDIRNLAGSIDMGLDELTELDLPDWGQQTLKDVRRMNRLAMTTATTALSTARNARSTFDLAELVERAVGLLRYDARRKDVRFESDLQAVQVEGHEDDLLRVAANLLGNALKYSPAGATVRIVVAAEERQARWVVADQGPGIPPEQLDRIFRAGVQAPGAEGGFGLGLGICRTLVSQHAGLIRARNGQRGAIFEVILPRAR
jgi:signal transduction histidine kinase